ncbi:MAG: hypothetical protein A2622_13810 [Bdellovibrionales bacterium RIFCSPHIGHO2_01_FULL_40_29]|nr:MAG: hypothetical protein A2622_13810 [Bdellovibrionales bacterium RIFCSPHIGHO2_01_FULL_40_29]OFZ35226.1 MAG: hypothetical protein A3D17_14460 [Bdellovibrionales bacterium RIFCSPHIGHO2_02_FULL_40_15]
MSEKFSFSDVYDKNLNFLIGSGASFGLFPTLQLKIKGQDGSAQTIETLATKFDKDKDEKKRTLLFMHYYKTCIEPVLEFDLEATSADAGKKAVINNYEKFIKTILSILKKKKSNDLKICNMFTTNYDGCFAHVADEIIKTGVEEFVLNDGTRGFFRRHLSAKNYNSHVRQSGVFDKFSTQVPQINLIHIHGSAYWKKEDDNILVDYRGFNQKIDMSLVPDISSFSAVLNDESKKISDIQDVDLTDKQISDFWEKYNSLPIVNPTKWKFYETLFEEHYYQMLRHLSYELEKPGSVLITFGFSFADEHILNLIKRSLGNPTLQVFVSCFNESERTLLARKFDKFKNITFLTGIGGNLDFSNFNDEIFTMKESSK